MIDGPRLLAASPELTVTGGLGDGRQLHMHHESFGVVVDGPDEVRRKARLCLREGVDNIKLNISGDFGTDSAPAAAAVMTDAEVEAGVEAAHTIGTPGRRPFPRLGLGQARGAAWRRRHLPLRLADEEALDMLEAAKDRIFTGPAIGLIVSRLRERARRQHGEGPALLER